MTSHLLRTVGQNAGVDAFRSFPTLSAICLGPRLTRESAVGSRKILVAAQSEAFTRMSESRTLPVIAELIGSFAVEIGDLDLVPGAMPDPQYTHQRTISRFFLNVKQNAIRIVK